MTNRETGYYHLTPNGWLRQDSEPFPSDRVETWSYELERPAEDAKDRICLTRIWTRPEASVLERDALRSKYAQPITTTPERNITLECQV